MKSRYGTLIAAVGVCLAMAFVVSAFTEEPGDKMAGPVAKAETWTYSLTQRFGVYEEALTQYAVAQYDEAGDLIETVKYTPNGSVEGRVTRVFDSAGRIMEVSTYIETGALESREIYTYEGTLRIRREYDSTGVLSGASDSTLDQYGNAASETKYDVETGDPSSRVQSTYTNTGEPSSQRVYSKDGSLAMTHDYVWDTNGMDWPSVVVVWILGISVRVEFGYQITQRDEYGNWLEKKSYQWKEQFGRTEWVPSAVYRRTLTYTQ